MSSGYSCYRDQTTGKADKRYCLNNQALWYFTEGLFYFKKQDFSNPMSNVETNPRIFLYSVFSCFLESSYHKFYPKEDF